MAQNKEKGEEIKKILTVKRKLIKSLIKLDREDLDGLISRLGRKFALCF